MDKEWIKDSIDKIMLACNKRNLSLGWHQTISGSGIRAILSQQFDLNIRKYTIGWNDEMFLIGIDGIDKVFKINTENPEETLDKVISYIQMR